jgi:hypothetical protein
MPDLFNGKSRLRSASSVRPARSQESVPSAPQPVSPFQMSALLSALRNLGVPRSTVLATLPLNVLDGSLYVAVQQEIAVTHFLWVSSLDSGRGQPRPLFVFCQWLVERCQVAVAVTRLVNRPFTRRQWAAAVAGPIPSFPSIGALIPLWSWPPLGKERMWPAAVAAEPAHAGRCQCRLCEEGLSGVAP